MELETQLVIAKELGFVDTANPAFVDLAEVGRLLIGLIRSLERDDPQ